MKIRITDLMDYYRGEPVKLTPREGRSAGHDMAWDQRSTHRMRRPLLAASVLVLIVAGAFALGLGLGRSPDGGGALDADTASVETVAESTVETLPPELPAQVETVPEHSAAEEPEAPQEESVPEAGIAPVLLEGERMSTLCYGNLLWVDGSYYTMTEAGPEPVEVQELNVAVELYGTWNVKIAYAVIDGELAFRELSSAEEPGDALAYPVPGSPDTVMLEVFREDVNQLKRCGYKFFYNVLTGEISDPLAGVPELFSHGEMITVQFNDARTRAIVDVSLISEEGYSDGMVEYICDLTTGEMVSAEELAGPYMPEPADPEASVRFYGGCRWKDDDTLLMWALEQPPREMTEENGFFPFESYPWLISYNMAAATLNYKLREVESHLQNEPKGEAGDFSHGYLHGYTYNSMEYLIVNSADGARYQFPEGMFQDMWGDDYDAEGSRVVLRDDDDETLYLLDDDKLGWVKLNDCLNQLPEDAAFFQFVTEEWLCMQSSQGIFCYHIPEDLPWTPYVVK